MTEKEKSYLIQRVSEVARDKERELYDEQQKEVAKIQPTGKVLWQALQKGTLKMRKEMPHYSVNMNTPLQLVYDFTKIEAQVKKLMDATPKRVTAVRQEVMRVKDVIMLGTDTEAKEILAKFIAMKF